MHLGEELGKGLTSSKAQPSETIREDHLHTDGHVFPGTEVITGPHRTETLRASVEGTREDERSRWRVCSLCHSLVGQI